MTLTYTKLAADGSDLPADATDHLAVRIDRDLLTRPIILTAHRSPELMSWADAKVWAERLDTYGWSWRLPTIDVPGIVARVREVFDGPMGHCGSLFARYQPSDVTIEVLTFHFHEPWDEFPEAAIRQWAHTLAALDAALLPEGEK